jgi:hypothetical protein
MAWGFVLRIAGFVVWLTLAVMHGSAVRKLHMGLGPADRTARGMQVQP